MAVKIDANGFYLEDVPKYAGEEETEEIVLTPIPTDRPFWHPKYDRDTKTWSEGLSETQIRDRIPLQNPAGESPVYLKRSEAEAVLIAFAPAEASLVIASNLQTALEQVVSYVSTLQGQVTALKALQKSPQIHDTFTDLNNTSLSAHALNTAQGSKWIEQVGVWSISNNQAASNGAAGSLAWIESKLGLQAIVEAEITLADATVPQGLIFRYVSTTQHWRICYAKSSGKLILYEVVGTTINSRTAANVSVVFGQTYRLRVVLDAGSINVYLQDELKITWNSTANQEATKHGLYSSSSGGTRFDNFKVIAL